MHSAEQPVASAAETLTWGQICECEEFRGRWVALEVASYDEATGKATEGQVVDVDDDLSELCQRVRDSELRNCAILFCSAEAESAHA